MNEFDYLAKIKDKINSEKYVEAISLCNKALKINSELTDIYNLRGNANYELGYYDKSADDFTNAIEREPNNSQHYFDRSWTYEKLNRMEDAIIDISKALKLEPKNSCYYFTSAKFKFWIGRYKEAREDFSKGIEIKPTEQKYISRGDCYMRLKKYNEAIADYTSAIKIEPESYLAYNQRGLAKMELEQIEEAIKDFEKAIEIYPEAAYPRVNIGYAKIALGKKDAMKYFNKAVKVFPSADIYLERVKARGKIFFRETALKNLAQNKDIKAEFGEKTVYNETQAKDDIKDLNKALKDDPDNIEVLEFRASRYYYLGKFDKSIADCTRLIELNLDNPIYYFARAKASLSWGNYQDAIEYFSKCIDLNRNKIDIEPFLLRAETEYKLGQYRKVIDDTTVVISFSESSDGYYYRGLAHYKLGHFFQAVSDIYTAAKINPDILETFDEKLPKLIKLGIWVNIGAGVGVNIWDSYKDHKPKTERPIGLVGIKRSK